METQINIVSFEQSDLQNEDHVVDLAAYDYQKFIRVVDKNAVSIKYDELALAGDRILEDSQAFRKALIESLKRDIKFMTLLVIQPLASLMPEKTIRHFEEVIVGLRIAVRELDMGECGQ